jgi:hypothetical protein
MATECDAQDEETGGDGEGSDVAENSADSECKATLKQTTGSVLTSASVDDKRPVHLICSGAVEMDEFDPAGHIHLCSCT